MFSCYFQLVRKTRVALMIKFCQGPDKICDKLWENLPQCPETWSFCRWRRQTSCSLLMNPWRWNPTERKEAASIGNSYHCLHWKPCWCQRYFLREFRPWLCWDLLLYWTTLFLRLALTRSGQLASSQVLGWDWFQAWPTASRRGIVSYPAYSCFVQQKSYSVTWYKKHSLSVAWPGGYWPG